MSNRSDVPNIPTPVPQFKILLLGSILLANNASIWMIFSFLPFMVSFYYPSMPTTELGFQAGILGSAFSAGGLIGNFVSGILSDKFGRRPALLWGLVGTALSSLCFGFSPTFWFAAISRFMWGALNGNIGVAKTYLAEISDDTNLARGMAYFGVIGSIGRVIGPVIGGLLSYPANHFPDTFGGTVFETYPFALPSIVITLNCIIMFVVTYFFLPETLNLKVMDGFGSCSENATNGQSGMERNGVRYSALSGGCDEVNDSNVDLSKIDDNNIKSGIELTPFRTTHCNSRDGSEKPLLREHGANDAIFSPLKRNDKRFSGDTDAESDDESKSVSALEINFSTNGKANYGVDERDLESGSSHSPLLSPTKKRISFSSLVTVKTIDIPRLTYKSLKQVAEDEIPLDEHSGSTPDSDGVLESRGTDDLGEFNSEECLIRNVRYSNGAEYFESVDSHMQSVSTNLAYLLRQRHIFITTTLYGASSFVVIIGNEIFTLWVVTSIADGGLGYDTQQIGTAIMICGIAGTVLQLTVYPLAVEKLGVLAVHRYGGLIFALSCVILPMLSLGAEHRSAAVTMSLVVITLTLQALAATWYLVSTFVLISNSCYSHQLATVNGIGQTCASIGRLTGPYLGSVLFAWSEMNGLNWPFNQYLVFYLLSLLVFLIYHYSLLLPKSLQRRKREPKLRTWEEGDEQLHKLQQQTQDGIHTPVNTNVV